MIPSCLPRPQAVHSRLCPEGTATPKLHHVLGHDPHLDKLGTFRPFRLCNSYRALRILPLRGIIA